MFQLGNLLDAINYRVQDEKKGKKARRASTESHKNRTSPVVALISSEKKSFRSLHIMAEYQAFINSINIYAPDDIKQFFSSSSSLSFRLFTEH